MKYKLSDNTWDNDEIRAINEVIRTGYYTMGKKTEEFEKQFAKFFGAKYAIMVNSGSSANLLAIASLVYSGKLQKGDEVIVPAVSWSTTYFPLSQHGLKLKFVDIDNETLNLDLEKVQNAISKETKAIFTVNLLGNPNDFVRLNEICSKNNLLLLEDNCEALGAKYNNKFCGTHGVLGTFSTFYSHHITTMEGGVVTTDNEDLYHHMLAIRAHGWTRNLPRDSRLYKKSLDSFYESFNFILPGYNLRPVEFEAAVGLEQIKKIKMIIRNRRLNAEYFEQLFNDNANVRIQKEVGQSSWFGFAIILKNELKDKRDIIINSLISKGIEVRPIVAGNFTRSPVVRFLDYEIDGKLTNADYIHNHGFFIGNHSKEIFKELDYLKSNLIP